MKKLIFIISCIFLFYGCIFTYDPARGLFYVHNNSDAAIYVYFQCGKADSLPIFPSLKLFLYIDANMEDAHGNPIKSYFSSPEYRINAYSLGSITIGGTRNNPCLPCKENEVTLFFITEKTMCNYDWNKIYKNQMFTQKIVLTKDELENINWTYTYSPVERSNVLPLETGAILNCVLVGVFF